MDGARKDRRAFLRKALAAGVAVSAPGLAPKPAAGSEGRRPGMTGRQQAGIGRLDHVAVPMRNVDEMIDFYRGLGFTVREGGQIVSVHFADEKINFHRPSIWESGTFDLRASAAVPPCGDFCWVWEGTAEQLVDVLARVGAEVVAEGARQGGRNGGDAVGESVYIRDPDGNLLEFIRYP